MQKPLLQVMIDRVLGDTQYDLDKNGTVSTDELTNSQSLLELELREEKAEAQKRMSWVSLFAVILVTAIVLSPIVSDSRVEALSSLLSMFYIACASIVGFYFGATAYMSK